MSGEFQPETRLGVTPGNRQGLFYGLLILAGLLCLGLYLFLFRPVSSEVARYESGLEATWRNIADTGLGYPEEPGAHLTGAEKKLAAMRELAANLVEQNRFTPGLPELLASPFRVLEFEQRRFDVQQSLATLATSKNSEIPADFMSALPSYYTTTERQHLLWLHLEFFNHTMIALLSAGEDLRIIEAESLPVRTLPPVAEGPQLHEIRLRLSVEGPASALAAFLNASLPDGKRAGSPIGKKAYQIDRIDFRNPAELPNDRVQLNVRLSGFVIESPSI